MTKPTAIPIDQRPLLGETFHQWVSRLGASKRLADVLQQWWDDREDRE